MPMPLSHAYDTPSIYFPNNLIMSLYNLIMSLYDYDATLPSDSARIPVPMYYDSDVLWLFYIRLRLHVSFLFGMFMGCPRLKLEWDSLLSISVFPTPLCFHFSSLNHPLLSSCVSYHVWVISEPPRLVGRLLTSSDFIVFLHRRGSWHYSATT